LMSVLLWKTHHFAFPFGLLGPLAAVGMVLAWRHRPQASLLLLCIGAYSASLLLFFITGRYRLPLVPLLLLFAGYALIWLVQQGQARQWRPLGIGVALVVLLGIAANAGLRPADPLADAEIHFDLGRSQAQQGQYAAAVHSFGTAVQLDPNYLRARHNLGAALAALKRYDEAEAVYQQALAQAPEDRGLHLNLAALYRATGRYGQAVEHYRRVLATKADAAVFLFLGRVYKKMGATEQARKAFVEALSGDEMRAQAANELGLIEVRQGALERAVDYFAMALKAEPDNHLIAFNIGAAYHDLGQFDKAAEFYRLTLSLAPEYAKAQRALTRLQRR
ncbi:MAG: tetratricopeptide repeat protein, partial [Gemmatimonadota bacterium]|nr:tetratricopeptide repeat protein [Gemmatimonadota bacterium]